MRSRGRRQEVARREGVRPRGHGLPESLVKQARARSFYKSTVVGGRGADVERGQGHGVAPCGRLQRLRHRESGHHRGGEGRGREGEALNPGRVRRGVLGSCHRGVGQGEQGRRVRTGGAGAAAHAGWERGRRGGRTWVWAGGRCRFTEASGRCRFTEGRTRGGSLPLAALIVV
jgi:hypothetical protein